MLGQSGLLTLLGMCVVFSFIIILILCMTLLKAFVHAAKLDRAEEKSTSDAGNSAAAQAGDDGAVIAAIAAAIREKQSV